MSNQFLTYHSKGSVRNATALAQHRAKTDVTRVYSEEQRESTHTVREAAPQAHVALAYPKRTVRAAGLLKNLIKLLKK